MYLAGYDMFAIAEALTHDDIPRPSPQDRNRNPHRPGLAWSKTAIRVILTNPRYTGHQVWNKQRTDEVLLDVNDVALGHTPIMRWNDRERWVISKQPAHEALIDQTDFDRVQEMLTRRARTATAPKRAHRSWHSPTAAAVWDLGQGQWVGGCRGGHRVMGAALWAAAGVLRQVRTRS